MIHKSGSTGQFLGMRDVQTPLILSLDQGTTSTRAILFNHEAKVVSMSQKEHQQIFPQPGWVEHDALEIWDITREVVAGALARGNANNTNVKAVGVTNQRETTVVWNKHTGVPVYNAIVWQDTRTQSLVQELEDLCHIDWRRRTGLPPATYFSGPKAKWILDNVEGARDEAEAGELLFGTMDSWLVWNMTGGPAGGVHVTDVTNASRTMLMDIATLQWDTELCGVMGIPVQMLPRIVSSSAVVGLGREAGLLACCPIAGIMGDQQAATFGQACFRPGDVKTTYGTGNFLLTNTGEKLVHSAHGLLSTVAYKVGLEPPVYALEGSVAVSGSLVRWLRDQLGMIESAADIETLALTVDNNGGCYFVPAFSGLYAPHWRPDARGLIHGLSFFNTRGHIARAALESTAFQTKDVCDAMVADLGKTPLVMKVDGGMTANNVLMQFQADILDCRVVRSEVTETTALGAAFAAGIAVGFWKSLKEVARLYSAGQAWEPSMKVHRREHLIGNWKKAVNKSCGWLDDETTGDEGDSESVESTATETPMKAETGRGRIPTESTCYPETKEAI